MCSVVMYVWQGWYPKNYENRHFMSIKFQKECSFCQWKVVDNALFFLGHLYLNLYFIYYRLLLLVKNITVLYKKCQWNFCHFRGYPLEKGLGKSVCVRERDAATWNSWFPLLWKPQDPIIPFDLTHTEHWQSFQLKNDVTFVCVSVWVTLITSSACEYFTYFPLY